MSILNWWASRQQRKREAYTKNHASATPQETEKLKRRWFKTRLTGGMPDGTGISPTGRPMDFTADEKPPPY